MAEKSAPRKRPARQQVLDALSDTEKTVAERREAQAKPEDKVEARNAAQAVAVADDLAAKGVVQSIGELKSSIGRMLGDLSDRLEEQVSRYVQVQRAIAAREQELKDIYEIQRSASTLTALIETHDRKREELETEMSEEKEQLRREIEETRAKWEEEENQRTFEQKEREVGEQKRRDREKEEYLYAFKREQARTRDEFADETAKANKELADRKAEAERELSERERAIKTREEELAGLRAKVEAFPKDLETAVAQAVRNASARQAQEATAREELSKREFAGEKNVLTTRIASLEHTVKDQSEQISKLLAQAEKAYAQVQEIAVRAIEGSGSAKQLASLQQMLADQSRKGGTER